tara:strand:+ start:400 stop:789 length:390 start_codon:yes stop_codon:yes gene_type:complete
MLTAAILFFGGVIAHKFASYIFDLSKRISYYNNAIFSSLRMMKYVDDTIRAALAGKYALMSEGGMSDEQVEKEKEKDEKVVEFWRNISIVNLVGSVPKKYRAVLKFKNWNQAMRILDKAVEAAAKQESK